MRIHHEPISLTTSGQCPTADLALNWPHAPVRSLYIHVPFCFHKCHYCDFYSFVDTHDRQEQFVSTLQRELIALSPHADAHNGGLNTIFIGGGTPSLLRPELWRVLLATLNDHFHLASLRTGGEFTVECNPETVTPELMTTLAAGGVNRVSVGAQTFNTAHLKTLERWHDPVNVQRALKLAANAGIERRSVDLIYAIPHQTLADVRTDLDHALSLSPGVEHISAYCLTYEPNTAMTKRVQRGDIIPLDDDLAADMQILVFETLRDAGFERYEVSNFSKSPGWHSSPSCARSAAHAEPNGANKIGGTGKAGGANKTGGTGKTGGAGKAGGTGVPPVRPPSAQSLHNLAYWRNESWLAAGPSASGHILTTDPATGLPAGVRWKNIPRLSDWMTQIDAGGGSPIVDYEPPDPARALIERIMMGVRVAEGLDAAEILARADHLNAGDALRARITRQIAAGFLHDDPQRWRLTETGFLHADGVAADLMGAIDSA